jgi:dolichyl-phosphate-mannose-protein mannosyltransferase
MIWIERAGNWIEQNSRFIYVFLLTILGSITFGFQFTQPTQTQWDEVYYISPVARYEKGIFFMESHPPLGKLILTAGDLLFSNNKSLDTSTLVRYDTVNGGGESAGILDDLPANYNFFGIRFFPVVAAILIPLVVFSICYKITKVDWLSFIAGSMVVLDNAMVLHFRGAMLDSILILLMLVSLYFGVKGSVEWLETKKIKLADIVWCTVFSGLAISTKYNAVVTILPLFLLCILGSGVIIKPRKTLWSKIDYGLFKIADTWTKFIIALFGVAFIFLSVWGVHFLIAKNYNSSVQNEQGLFKSNEALSESLKKNGSLSKPMDYVNAISSGINYTFGYHLGVPTFEKCELDALEQGLKLNQEKYCNGSKPWMWPFIARSVNFRIAKYAESNKSEETISLATLNTLTKEEKESYTIKGAYYTLIGNPVIWGTSLIVLLIAFFTVLYGILNFLIKRIVPSNSWWIVFGVFMVWLSYMILALVGKRILYLYHYFFPLISTFILFASLIFHYKLHQRVYTQWLLSALPIIMILGFLWFAPYTYGIALNEQQISWRNWAPWWVLIR